MKHPRGAQPTDRPDPSLDGATAPIAESGALARKAPLTAVIRILDANASPRTFVLRGGTCTIGCSRTCDVIVDEPSVSRAHVELELVAEGVAVRDLGSRNGTFYFGQRVEKVVLSLGTRIRAGRVTIAIDADEDALTSLAPHGAARYGPLVGASLAMRRLFAVLARLEGSLATVLVSGESGAGKELVASALHEQSRVASGPFVALNCGALPREVIASELFGHRKGAFTGAVDARRGAFESADQGTLFLDEIGELPLDLQPTLLRAIELGEIRAVGDDKARRVRVRLVAATNRDLEAEARAGRFRQDLFYRLAVVRIIVPPLRERREDIEPLALAFARSMGLDGLPPPVLEALKGHAYPGNVRELRNAVESYHALGMVPKASADAPDESALDQHLRAYADPRSPYAAQKEALVEKFTVAYLEALLELTGNNQSEAARISGLNRGYVGRLVARFGLGRAPAAARRGPPASGEEG
jgi:DNA-binding NtrC family response regulator